MRIEWAVVVLVVGCGSSASGVDANSSDASPDAPTDAPADACPLGAWSSPQLIGELVSASNDASPWISDDRLELAFESARSGSRRIYLTSRSSTAAPFGPPVLVDTMLIQEQGTPTISDDGHDLYFTAGRDEFPTATRTPTPRSAPRAASRSQEPTPSAAAFPGWSARRMASSSSIHATVSASSCL